MTAEQRRESVLRAAASEFAVGGLAGTSTELIARRAGISQPYLFRLFPRKKDLFIASVERIFAQVGDAFQAAAEGLAGEDALNAMAQAYEAFLTNRHLLMHQMQAYAACDDPDVCAATRRGFGRLWTIVENASGAAPADIRRFFAMGMLLNVIATMDLGRYDERWVQDCIPMPMLKGMSAAEPSE